MLSAYEHERLAHMKRNQEVLQSLGLANGSPLGIDRPARQKPKREPRPPAPRREPERRSSRVAESERPRYKDPGRDDVERAKAWMRRHNFSEGEAEATMPRDPIASLAAGIAPESPDDLIKAERPAFAALRKLRLETSRELQIESYKVAHNRALCELIRNTPAGLAGVEECWGFGPAKTKKFGELFLEA